MPKGSRGGSKSSIPSRLKGIGKFREYEYNLDKEFNSAIGKRLSNKLEKATSTRSLINALKNDGFKIERHGESGRNNERKDIAFAREKNGVIELLTITTRERWENGKKYFWLDQATYSWHAVGD